MKRSPMARRTAPMPRENRKRAGERKRLAFGAQARLCRTLPCCVCGVPGSDAHHEPPRSRGGLDDATVPLCRPCHVRRHQLGALRFWQRAGVHWKAVRDALREAVQ